MSAGKQTYRRWAWANEFADWLALKSPSLVLRYATLVLTIGALCLAALLFRRASVALALVAILLAFCVVLLVIWYWIEDSAHRRRLLLKLAVPSERDGVNPDLRDEVMLACAGLLAIVPIAFYIMNDQWLGFRVEQDRFGLQSTVCASDAGMLCALAHDAFQLQAWLLFTIEQFVSNAPFGGFLTTWFMPTSGVEKTGVFSGVALLGVQLLFGGLVFKLVMSYFSKTQDQIRDAIDLLKVSSFMAAGLGPIAVAPLVGEIEKAKKSRIGIDDQVLSSAFEALLEIGQVYAYALSPLNQRTLDILAWRFDEMLKRANESVEGNFPRKDLRTIASLVCLANVEGKFKLLVSELMADRPGHYKRMELIDALIEFGRGEKRELALMEIMANDPWAEVANRILRFRNRLVGGKDTRISGSR